jgi:hypothetical protein
LCLVSGSSTPYSITIAFHLTDTHYHTLYSFSNSNVNSQQPTRNSSESTKQLQKKAWGGLTASLLGAAPALYASKVRS